MTAGPRDEREGSDRPVDRTAQPGADFDGHLEWPLLRMTPRQRLDWLTDAALLMLEARRARKESGPVGDDLD